MKYLRPRQPGLLRPATRGFSLVEVTLALGVTAFGLVAVLGVLPVALATGRASIAQTRAAGLAETVFAGLRQESFKDASPGRGLEADGTAPLQSFDLSTLGTTGSDATRTVYAVLSETEAVNATTDPRRLRFVADRAGVTDALQKAADAGVAAGGYELAFVFDAKPEGTLAAGQASRVLLTVRPVVGTGDAFRFVTLIANRGS